MVGAHNIAVADGYAPDSDDYFNYIEGQMGFNRQAHADQGEDIVLSTASKSTQNRSAPPAAPSTRTASSTGGRTTTVRLTPEMKEMASILGMSPEDYAKNMLDLKKEGKMQ
jgi:phage I-like protein